MRKRMSNVWYFMGWAVVLGIMNAYALEVVVDTGPGARNQCPVCVSLKGVSLPEGIAPGKDLKLVGGKEEIPAMLLNDAGEPVLYFILNGLSAKEQKTFQLTAGKTQTLTPVKIDKKDKTLDIQIGDRPFTVYVFAGDKVVRPYFYPLFGPQGARMTRGYPMDYHEGEEKDHPHHHSLWVAHGNVNGIDNWSVESGHGFTKQTRINFVESGPVCGRFSTFNDWTSADGKKILEDHRVLTIWGAPETGRIIDFDLTFMATEGDVKFGDTKEGGLVSLRVADSMTEKRKKGGIITNANGGVGMSETWGKSAPWCDYSGPVDGITAGLSILDHPANPFFPTYFHVRDYGLFTANPFGLSAFTNDKSKDGSRILKKDQPWHLRYRVYIHAGDVKSSRVAEAYSNFADGPKITVR